LYIVCNGGHESLITEKMNMWYQKWGRRLYYPHMAEYCDVRLRKVTCINGRRLNQMEEVQPEVTGMQFGVFDNNGCGSSIRG